MPASALLGSSRAQSNGNSPRTPTNTGKERHAAQGSKHKGGPKTTKAISRKGRMFIGLLAERAGVTIHDTGDQIREKFESMEDREARDRQFDSVSYSHIASTCSAEVVIYVQRDGKDERGIFTAYGLMKAVEEYRLTLS